MENTSNSLETNNLSNNELLLNDNSNNEVKLINESTSGDNSNKVKYFDKSKQTLDIETIKEQAINSVIDDIEKLYGSIKGNQEYFDFLIKEDLYNRDHYKFLSNFLIKLKAKHVDLSHRKDHDEVFKYDENKPLIEKEIADIESNYEIMKYILVTWDFRLYVENYWTVPELQSIKFLRLTLEQIVIIVEELRFNYLSELPKEAFENLLLRLTTIWGYYNDLPPNIQVAENLNVIRDFCNQFHPDQLELLAKTDNFLEELYKVVHFTFPLFREALFNLLKEVLEQYTLKPSVEQLSLSRNDLLKNQLDLSNNNLSNENKLNNDLYNNNLSNENKLNDELSNDNNQLNVELSNDNNQLNVELSNDNNQLNVELSNKNQLKC
jgi:hypothetical protein